jgi:hypothetical protein
MNDSKFTWYKNAKKCEHKAELGQSKLTDNVLSLLNATYITVNRLGFRIHAANNETGHIRASKDSSSPQ